MSATQAARRLHGAAYNRAIDANEAGRLATATLRAMKDRKRYDRDTQGMVPYDGWTAEHAARVCELLERQAEAARQAWRDAVALRAELLAEAEA